MSDDALIVALDVPMLLPGLELAKSLAIRLKLLPKNRIWGMRQARAWRWQNELIQEHGKRHFLDMKL